MNDKLFTLPLADDIDGDDVRCRWSRTSDSECGGVCDAFPGAILDEVLVFYVVLLMGETLMQIELQNVMYSYA